jgi:hypothetical protein
MGRKGSQESEAGIQNGGIQNEDKEPRIHVTVGHPRQGENSYGEESLSSDSGFPPSRE